MAIPFFTETEVFTSGAEGYHTFRIPALTTTPDGSLLAFSEGRENGSDDHDALYIVLKRSTDNGLSWENMQILYGDGKHTFHNPTVVVDKQTGTIWLSFNRDAYNSYVMSSNNNGMTWSTAVDITGQVNPKQWPFYAMAPGHGIQLSTGRLIIPANHGYSNRRDPIFSRSHVIYSDDHGLTWGLGGNSSGGGSECEVVETSGQELYMTIRSTSRQNQRLFSTSNDCGNTWSELQVVEGMKDAICQASIIRYTTASKQDKDRVVLSNIHSDTRDHITLNVSYDECTTWTAAKILYTGPAAYSDLAVTPDMMINCLYERGTCSPYDSIRLARFNLEWLTDCMDGLVQ